MPGAGGATRTVSSARARRDLVGGPKRAGHRVLVVREIIGERSRGAVLGAGIAVEAGRNVAERRPPKPNERRERDHDRDPEQKDAADAKFAGREQPEAEPRDGEEERRNRQRPDERRPSALDQQHAPGQSRKPGKSSAAVGARSLWRFFFPVPAQSPPRLSECTRNASNHGGSVSRAINSSNVLRARTTA